MQTEQFDTAKWEPLIHKLANGFSYVAKTHGATCSNADLVQEAWLALLKANKGFDPSKGIKFITYAYVYVYRELLKYVRRQTKLRGKLDFLSSNAIIAAENGFNPGQSNPSGLQVVESQDLINRVMEDLTPHERTLIIERFFNEGKVKDIAEKTGVSSSSVSQHLDRTIEKMRRTVRRGRS